MEMALTAVGLRVTGQVVGAVEIARRIVGTPHNEGAGQNHDGTQQNGNQTNLSMHQEQLATELANVVYSHENKDTQGAVIKFLTAFLPMQGGASKQRLGQTALNHHSTEGQTLLHLASFLGFTDLVHFLIRAEVTIDVHDRNGYTAFIFAAMNGHVNAARLLRAAGAREGTCTFSNQTAASLARRAGHEDAYRAMTARTRRSPNHAAATTIVPGEAQGDNSSNQSSIDGDNPSSVTDNDSFFDENIALSPNRLTTPADIMAVRRRSPSPATLLPKSKYDSRAHEAGSTTPRSSAATLRASRSPERPPPYMAVDKENWLQRTLSHLPQPPVIPPTPNLKDFIPPALWDKLPSAQVFVPQMPNIPHMQLPSSEHQWGAQAWMAMPMSAFMNILNAQPGENTVKSELAMKEATSANAAREANRNQAIEVAQAVGSVNLNSPMSSKRKKDSKLRKRKDDQSSSGLQEQNAQTVARRPPPTGVDVQRPAQAKGKLRSRQNVIL